MIDPAKLSDDLTTWSNKQLIAGFLVCTTSNLEVAAALALIREAATRDPWTFCLEANELYYHAFVQPHEQDWLQHASTPLGEQILRGVSRSYTLDVDRQEYVLHMLALLQRTLGLTTREILLNIS